MESTRIYRLDHLPAKLRQRLYEAQMEAARIWTLCRDLHLAALVVSGRGIRSLKRRRAIAHSGRLPAEELGG